LRLSYCRFGSASHASLSHNHTEIGGFSQAESSGSIEVSDRIGYYSLISPLLSQVYCIMYCVVFNRLIPDPPPRIPHGFLVIWLGPLGFFFFVFFILFLLRPVVFCDFLNFSYPPLLSLSRSVCPLCSSLLLNHILRYIDLQSYESLLLKFPF